MDTVVDRPQVDVLRVRADMNGKGPKGAFAVLESKLPTLKGRRFFGTIRAREEGLEYYACVERLATEDAATLGLESATVPGGRYVRRRIWDWAAVVAAGKMEELSQDLARGHVLDPDRPSIEFYRSRKEMHFLLPLAGSDAGPTP